jgi:hypothetical protein
MQAALGLAYRLEGHLELAVPMLEETLTRKRLVFGPDDPSTFDTANNLSDAYQYAARFKEALVLSDQTLKLCLPRLGVRHRITLRAVNCLSTVSLVLLKQDPTMIKEPDAGEIHKALEDLAEYYAQSGKPDQAAFWRSQSVSNQVPSHVVNGAATRPAP